MPSEKKKCGACKDKLTREGYAKEQWQNEESERRCLACVAANRPNTAAQTPEEKAERDAFVSVRRSSEQTERRDESYQSDGGAAAGRVRRRADGGLRGQRRRRAAAAAAEGST